MIIGTIILLSILLTGGGADPGLFPEDFEDQVKDVVKDKDVRGVLKDSAKDADKAAKAYNKSLEKFKKDMIKIDRDYDSTPDDFSNLVQGILDERENTLDAILETRRTLKENLTEEQWEQAFRDESKDD